MFPVSFDITAMENGWLFAKLETPVGPLLFENSVVVGAEQPKKFLQALIMLMNGTSSSEWICWQAESYAYIWQLSLEEDAICLRIYRLDSYVNLPASGSGLEDRVRFIEPERQLQCDADTFVRSVCRAFSEYRTGDGLEKWNCSGYGEYFPSEEYQQLRRLLRARLQG